MELGKERALKLFAGVAAAAVLSGGSAWAMSAVPGFGSSQRPVVANADEDTTSSTEAGESTTSSTGPEESTSTSTSFEDTTTSTTFEGTTTTSTSFESLTPTSAAGCKPGWGYGDKNHCHSGPPGQARGEGDAAEGCKPGWGYGDKNHCHTGPPGRQP